MNTLRRHGWRLALVASGVLTLAGGSMHPEADASDPLRQELATMTADESWVPGHTLIAVGTALLALGLWGAARHGPWPAARRALAVGAAVVGVYVVETLLHLAAVVDREALAAGEAAPVAFSHIGLAAVLYPVTGLTVVAVALRLAGSWQGPAKALAVPGVIGGALHAASVPLTIALPDTELSPVFALAGTFLALWGLAVGLSGIRAGRSGRSGVRPVEARVAERVS